MPAIEMEVLVLGLIQWIGLRKKLKENPILNGKDYIWFPVDFPLDQSIEAYYIIL